MVKVNLLIYKIEINQMYVNIRYMDPMGCASSGETRNNIVSTSPCLGEEITDLDVSRNIAGFPVS